MIKKLLCILLVAVLFLTLVGCRTNGNDSTDKPKAVDKNFFRQAAYRNGDFVYGATGTECPFYSNDYDEIMAAYELLKTEYKLDDFTYAFNYDDEDYSVLYHFTINPKSQDFDPESISSLSDCVSAASFIHPSIEIALNDVFCNVNHTGHSESHTASIRIIFDDAQPEAPKILEPSLLGYEASDYINLYENEPHYLYAITYNGELLFYAASCVEFDDDVLSFFKNYLVQFDCRQ